MPAAFSWNPYGVSISVAGTGVAPNRSRIERWTLAAEVVVSPDPTIARRRGMVRIRCGDAAHEDVPYPRQTGRVTESMPPDAFLESYPPGIRATANRLRAVVRSAAPGAIERVRLGWRLIGCDLPVGTRTTYFAFVAPEPKHVHLGFEHGI